MKVEFAKYRSVLENALGERVSEASEIVDIIMTTLRDHLPCSICGEIKPKKHFYPNKAYKARGGYSTICCECGPKYQKTKRTGRKPAEKDAKND